MMIAPALGCCVTLHWPRKMCVPLASAVLVTHIRMNDTAFKFFFLGENIGQGKRAAPVPRMRPPVNVPRTEIVVNFQTTEVQVEANRTKPVWIGVLKCYSPATKGPL